MIFLQGWRPYSFHVNDIFNDKNASIKWVKIPSFDRSCSDLLLAASHLQLSLFTVGGGGGGGGARIMASYRIFLCCVHMVCSWEYKTVRIIIPIGHLKCSFYLPGTQLVAMATLLLTGVHCLFSENVKNSQCQRYIVILYKHHFKFGIIT